MRTKSLAIAAALGLALLGLSNAASATSCTAGGTTFSADGTSACAGPIEGNSPPYNLNDPNDNPDMGLGFSDWASIEKDNIGEGGEDDGSLQITLGGDNFGTWRYTGTEGFGELLLLIKAGNSFATFLVSGDVNTWYDWSIVPPQGNGLSHMELFGRGTSSSSSSSSGGQVPEPGSLALLGLGLFGLGAAARRRTK